jgi:HEAT repeat protein
MDINFSQPMLFDFAETASGSLEFFPEVWGAAEKLTSPDVLERRDALDRLIVLDAPRLSPLVAYLVANRIFDSDLELRNKAIDVLGKILSPRETGKLSPPAIRSHLKEFCSQMGDQGFINLLEVAEAYPEAESSVASLFNLCSQSGETLVKILSDRKILFELRRQAIIFIGRVGFLEAIPSLEKFESRLESRVNGQKSMPFAPPSTSDENSLLPVVQATLALLKEP